MKETMIYYDLVMRLFVLENHEMVERRLIFIDDDGVKREVIFGIV